MSHQRLKLPPLNAVRAFDAAARCGGFQAAGAELNVSANAVARQVKLLEEWLGGVELFRRMPRGVALTEAGHGYFKEVAPLLQRLGQVSGEIARRSRRPVLTVSAMPSFAARWLIPRFARLAAEQPDLDVRIVASVPPVDFERDGVDVAVRLGPGPYPGLRADLLLRERFFPVCAPHLLERSALRTPEDLKDHVLLHDEWERRIPHQLTWADWLSAVGRPELADQARGSRYSFSHMTLQAAVAGDGIALASSALAADDLETGRLVRPFGDLSAPGPYAFWIVSPEAASESPKVRAFREWALAEVRAAP